MTAGKKKSVASGVVSVVKGYGKRLAGELSPRPDLVVEGEEEQTEGLREIREARAEEKDAK